LRPYHAIPSNQIHAISYCVPLSSGTGYRISCAPPPYRYPRGRHLASTRYMPPEALC
jgi:hypothetical protein